MTPPPHDPKPGKSGATARSTKAIDFFSATAGDYVVKHYDGHARTFMTVRQQRVMQLIESLRLSKGAAVLDAGCGPGHIAISLASQGLAVSALDGAAGMLEIAERNAGTASLATPIRFQQGDIEQLPYADHSFDVVVSTGVIEYLPDDAKVLGEFLRVLRPGGALILPVTNANAPSLWLESTVEFLKRRRWLLAPFNAVWRRLGRTEIHPRHFVTRQHRVSDFLHSLERAGFTVEASGYFFLLPWPRPFDQIAPRLTARFSERLERHAIGRTERLGEGFIVLARRPSNLSR